MFSQPARKRLQPARKRLQPVRKRLQPARKRLQLARKRLQSARKRLQPASQPLDWITAESREVSLGLLCKMHAQETASYARCCMCFAVQFFESTGGECFRIIPDVTEPQQVELHVWSICFPCWHFSMRCIFARKLLQHFALVLALSHGKQILRSIKIEFQCGDLRKYAGKRKTHGQIHGQLLGGRRSRALQLTR